MRVFRSARKSPLSAGHLRRRVIPPSIGAARSSRVHPILHGGRLQRASREPTPSPAPAPAPAPKRSIDCSLWPNRLAAFAINVAEYYLHTELGISPPRTGVWCSSSGKMCEVYFNLPPEDPNNLTVMVSMVKMPEAVIALAPTVGPRREYPC